MSRTHSAEPIDPQADEEIVLASANLKLYVSPWGASLRGLVADGITQIVTRYQGAHNKVGGQGDVLIPFPGRVKDGRYRFEGVNYQMDKNDGEGPNAIHGFLRKRLWNVVEQSGAAAKFCIDLQQDDAAGYPFPLHVEVSYEVNPLGLRTEYAITNMGESDAPVAAGFHPYFSVGFPSIEDAMLTLPFKSYLVYNDLIPTGEIATVTHDIDFREERVIADTVFNTCFLDPIRDTDGSVYINLRSADAGRSVRVGLGPSIDYVVLYSGDPLPESHRRKALAIEPMTCASDAFNHPDWGLKVLKPGETTAGYWTVAYHSTL